jgi:hypothetical protein
MNEKIMKALGFKKQMELVHEGKCPFCEKEIKLKDFRDEKSKREYGISGMCQKCQDRIFKKR